MKRWTEAGPYREPAAPPRTVEEVREAARLIVGCGEKTLTATPEEWRLMFLSAPAVWDEDDGDLQFVMCSFAADGKPRPQLFVRTPYGLCEIVT